MATQYELKRISIAKPRLNQSSRTKYSLDFVKFDLIAAPIISALIIHADNIQIYNNKKHLIFSLRTTHKQRNFNISNRALN